MMKTPFLLLSLLFLCQSDPIFSQKSPDEIRFVRQGARRLIFDPAQSISLASLHPNEIIGMPSMYPVKQDGSKQARVSVQDETLSITAGAGPALASIWFGGFNPFATYFIDLASVKGEGEIGIGFSGADSGHEFIISVSFKEETIEDVHLTVRADNAPVFKRSVSTGSVSTGSVSAGIVTQLPGTVGEPAGMQLKPGSQLIVQMLGSGFTVYLKNDGLPIVIAQSEFSQYLDLRKLEYIRSFQSHLHVKLRSGTVKVKRVESALTTGIGLADIRAITYENGEPFLDQGRLWYTMSIRGRALPHHLQGVFSLDPGVFDLRLEGVIVFDRGDGLWRNEIASHIFYDRNSQSWKGITTGFSAFANPGLEEKQLLAVSSERDPRFGFSVMKAEPMGMVGNIEDPHIIYDKAAGKWRMLACKNVSGFKTLLLESEQWNGHYRRIAGPGRHDATGTSIQRINGQLYCFSGSKEREIFIYSYPGLKEIGTLKMDLPPWDNEAGTRVWPNVIQLPEGYPVRYIALMMDRYNYPGLKGPNWTYGAVYLYYGH